MLAGLEEQHRRRLVDLRHQVQQHRGIGAERRDQRDPALEGQLDRLGQDPLGRGIRPAAVQPLGPGRERKLPEGEGGSFRRRGIAAENGLRLHGCTGCDLNALSKR